MDTSRIVINTIDNSTSYVEQSTGVVGFTVVKAPKGSITPRKILAGGASKIKDICYIEGERDIKTCNISFPPIKTKLKNRRLISLATDYSIHTLGMKEIFIKTASNDRNMIENLEAKGFESLGEEKGNVIYLKETEDTLNNQRKLA